MTEQEAWELDELVTNAEIELGPNGSDFFSQREVRLMGLDNIAAAWLRVKADATHKSPAQIISELVRKEITASA